MSKLRNSSDSANLKNNSSDNNIYSLYDHYPEYLQVQRTPAVISGNRVSFQTYSPDPNLFLSSESYIKIQVRINKKKEQLITGAITNSTIRVEDVSLMKTGNILSNSMDNFECRINGNSLIYNNPKYYKKYTDIQIFGKKYLETEASTSGSAFLDNTGEINFNGTIYTVQDATKGFDTGFAKSSDAFLNQSVEVAPLGTILLDIVEPINFALFQPKSSNMRKKHKLSELIPYVKQIGINFSLSKYAANMCTPYYGYNGAGAAAPNHQYRTFFEDDGIISAELVLKWVKPRKELVSLPDQVKLRSFNYDHRKYNILPNPLVNDTSTTFNLQNLYTYQVPSQMLLFATVDRDSDSFQANFLRTDSPVALSSVSFPDSNAFESNLIISSLNIRTNVNGGDTVIDNNYNLRELYNITVRNSNEDFPWSYNKFVGDPIEDPTTNTIIRQYQSYNYVLLNTSDLDIFDVRGEKTGKTKQMVWNISCNLDCRDGYGGKVAAGPLVLLNSQKKYEFHIVFIYDDYCFYLNKNGISYSEYTAKFV